MLARTLCCTCLLSLTAGPLAAFSLETIRTYNWAVGATVEYAAGSDFTLGDDKNEWDDSLRLVADIRYQLLPENRMDPFIGLAAYYDKKSWEQSGTGTLDMTSIGLGLQLGMVIKPQPDDLMGNISFGIMPYLRVSLGTADIDLQARGGPANDLIFTAPDDPKYRVDTVVGVDLRLRFGKRIESAVGFGFHNWQTGNVTAQGFNEFGNNVATEVIDFKGHEVFIRLGGGYRF